MVYTALPDMRIPWDNDGSVAGWWSYDAGVVRWLSGAECIGLNGSAAYTVAYYAGGGVVEYAPQGPIVFFPEQREVTAFYSKNWTTTPSLNIRGSNNSGNGQDGTWELASLPSGAPQYTNSYSWRGGIVPISFTGGKRTVRFEDVTAYTRGAFYLLHIYGEKATGQTPDDIIYIDHDTTPGVEYAAPEDFGDQPLGTSVVRQFRLKNTSATKTANTLNVQCNDSDFAISTEGTTWVVTINVASLGPGAQSATMYVRCTTPAPGNLLGPRFGRIVTTVGSWT